MRLKDAPKSKNFKDNTNAMTPELHRYSPALDEFWRRMHTTPNDESSIPQQTNPYSDPRGMLPAPYQDKFPIPDLTPEELTYIQDYGFKPNDIILLRAMKSSPGQIMEGWKFQNR